MIIWPQVVWTRHPFLPHEEGRFNGIVVGRRMLCCDGVTRVFRAVDRSAVRK